MEYMDVQIQDGIGVQCWAKRQRLEWSGDEIDGDRGVDTDIRTLFVTTTRGFNQYASLLPWYERVFASCKANNSAGTAW